MKNLTQIRIAETQCSCHECRGFCEHRPCWPTPSEAQALIDAGFGPRLMRDWWEGDRYDDVFSDIDLICPGGIGLEGGEAQDLDFITLRVPPMRCTFLSEEGKCELHDLGLKPLEGRLTYHDGHKAGLHEAVADSWNNPEAQALFESWKTKFGVKL